MSSLSRDDAKVRANSFRSYFKNVIRTLKTKAFPLVDFAWRFVKPPSAKTDKRFIFKCVSRVQIEQDLRSLQRTKATGIDELPSAMLKDCAKYISGPLCYIINLSIKSFTVPSLWKIAKVVPILIYKFGNTNLLENHRPISVLPVLSKLIEKAVHKQLLDYLEGNKLLNNCQYGFRKHRSTKLAATLLCDNIRRELDNGKFVGAIYIDLSKAFDTIGHAILLNKLASCGVIGNELAWFTDYLFDRNQIVEINNVHSNMEPICCGVPQGFILGPLLFIVFFNDIADKIQHSNVITYADDTVVYYSNVDVNTIEDVLNLEMDSIGEYCRENELLLNLKKGKTEAMLFGASKRISKNGRNLKIQHQNIEISFVKEYVYLGNTVDSNLRMNTIILIVRTKRLVVVSDCYKT